MGCHSETAGSQTARLDLPLSVEVAGLGSQVLPPQRK